MKKTLCLILAILTILACVPLISATAADGLTNVSKGCSYVSSKPYTIDADKYTGNYRNKVGNELTDGVKGLKDGGSEWYAFHSSPEGISDHYVTIDLGKKYTNIVKLSAEFCDLVSWGIQLPGSVKFYISEDGTNFILAGEAKKEDADGHYYDYVFYPKTFLTARYVKMVEHRNGGFNFVSEVEVFTGSEIQDGYNDEFFIKDRQNLVIVGNYLKGLADKSDFTVFAKQINSLEGVTVKDAKGSEKTSGIIVTGDTFTKKKKKVADLQYTFIIDGDVNGDGKADSKDYMLLKRHCLNTFKIEGAFLEAANLNGDAKVNSADYMLLKRYVLGTTDLYDKYGPQDGRGFVTEAWKGKVDTHEDYEVYTSWDMTVKRTKEGQYTFYYKAEGGDVELTMHTTPWGTWNLGGWSVKDSKGSHVFCGESTDWEYVYRVASSASAQWVWSGGNHGNEKLREFKIYDQNEKEIKLSVGQSATAKKIHIVEKTQLYWDPAGDDGKYNYSDSNIYAYAVRDYTLCGPQITLKVDYDYVKTAYYLMSYTGMMPIEKPYGLYCAALDGDGNVMTVCETLKKGSPDYDGPTYETKKAERVIIWGYGENADYKLDIRALTPDTCFDKDNGMIRFWDMNSGSNKLYISKFPAGGTKSVVESGSKVHTEVQWNFFK